MTKDQFLKGIKRHKEDSYTDFLYFENYKGRVGDKTYTLTFLVGDTTQIESRESEDEKGFRTYCPMSVIREDGTKDEKAYRGICATIRPKFEVFERGLTYEHPFEFTGKPYGENAMGLIHSHKIYRTSDTTDQNFIDTYESRQLAEKIVLDTFWQTHEKELTQLDFS